MYINKLYMELNKEQLYKLENIEDIKRFIFAGKAILTLESRRTGTWFTYKIRKAKDNKESPYFVSVLTGKNNEFAYTYMGTIFNNNGHFVLRLTKNSKIGENSLSYKAFDFFFNLINKNLLHEEINIYHKGVCCSCGRTLTTPESLKRGIGPFCGGKNIRLSKKDIRTKKLQKLNKKLLVQ